MNYEHETCTAIGLAFAAGREIMQAYLTTLEIHTKADGSPVTNADLKANALIVDGIRKRFPQDGIVAEEGGNVPGKRKWYIDPIDGTRALVEHNEQFAVHIGMCEEDSPTIGVVHKPVTGEIYVGVVGQGAYRAVPSGKRYDLNTSRAGDGLVAVVQSSWGAYPEYESVFRRIGVTDVVQSGSEGLRILKLVEGIADFRLSSNRTSTWDTCAPDAILRAAGGCTKLAGGGPLLYAGQAKIGAQIVYARNQQIMDRVQRTL